MLHLVNSPGLCNDLISVLKEVIVDVVFYCHHHAANRSVDQLANLCMFAHINGSTSHPLY